jgi:hypothetical protein
MWIEFSEFQTFLEKCFLEICNDMFVYIYNIILRARSRGWRHIVMSVIMHNFKIKIFYVNFKFFCVWPNVSSNSWTVYLKPFSERCMSVCH